METEKKWVVKRNDGSYWTGWFADYAPELSKAKRFSTEETKYAFLFRDEEYVEVAS